MPPGYDYGNARLRAMRSRLLTETDYLALLAKANVEEVITALTETPYKEDVEASLLRVSGARVVAEALRTNLTRTLRTVQTFFQGEPRRLLDMLLRRWDRHNLLAILRGQRRGVVPAEVLAAIAPVGQLDEVALRELVGQPGLQAVIDLMTTWRLPYASVLRDVQARTESIPDLDQLELALYRFHYASIQEALEQSNANSSLVLEQTRIEIDILNLSTALRLAHIPTMAQVGHWRNHVNDVRALLIEPGGCVRTSQLATLLAEASDIAGIVQGLCDSPYGQALAAGWRRHQAGEGGIAVLERELERWRAKHDAGMFFRDPLSMAIPIGYIGCKEVEVANLRLVSQAVALDMAREQARRDLIIV